FILGADFDRWLHRIVRGAGWWLFLVAIRNPYAEPTRASATSVPPGGGLRWLRGSFNLTRGLTPCLAFLLVAGRAPGGRPEGPLCCQPSRGHVTRSDALGNACFSAGTAESNSLKL